LGFWGSVQEFRIRGFRVRVKGYSFRVYVTGLCLMVQGLGFGFGVWGYGCRVQVVG
jgi:hypothetical protein